LIYEELDRLVESGITKQELDRAKGHMRGGVVLSLEDPSSRMTRLGKSELVHGEIISIDDVIARIEDVSIEDVAGVAQDLLKRESRVVSVIGPFTVDDFAGWTETR
jgi:predicted Zn-dependent peptidase